MKKALPFFLCLILMFSVSSIYAAEDSPRQVDVNAGRGEWVLQGEHGKEFLYNPATGEIIPEAHRLADGQAVPVPLQELLPALNASLSEDGTSPSVEAPTADSAETDGRVSFYRFEETSSRVIAGTPEKVGPDALGPTELSAGSSITIPDTYGGSFSLSAAVKDLISDSANFPWNQSLSTSASFGASYDVPAGSKGHVEFIPYLNKVAGKLCRATSDPTTGFTTDYVDQGEVWGASPIRLSAGFADGLCYPVIAPI